LASPRSACSHDIFPRPSMKLLSLFLFFLPFCYSAPQESKQKQLIELAAAGNGVIHLDEAKYDLLSSEKRNWSFAVHFTALDPRRNCNQCRSIMSKYCCVLELTILCENREFDPSWNAVARSWATAPKEHRDTHFFATLDFDSGFSVFQRVRFCHIFAHEISNGSSEAWPHDCTCRVRLPPNRRSTSTSQRKIWASQV
jgi:OST3 / OST6 family, transporter family